MDGFTKRYRAIIFGSITVAAFIGSGLTEHGEGPLTLFGFIGLIITLVFCTRELLIHHLLKKVSELPLMHWMSFRTWVISLAIFIALTLLIMWIFELCGIDDCCLVAEISIALGLIFWGYSAIIGSLRYLLEE